MSTFKSLDNKDQPNEAKTCGYLNSRYVTFAATPSCMREDFLYIKVKNFNTLIPHELIGEARVHLDIIERYGCMKDALDKDTEYRVDITSDASLEIKGEPTGLVRLFVKVSKNPGKKEQEKADFDSERMELSYLGKPRYGPPLPTPVDQQNILDIGDKAREFIHNWIRGHYLPWRTCNMTYADALQEKIDEMTIKMKELAKDESVEYNEVIKIQEDIKQSAARVKTFHEAEPGILKHKDKPHKIMDRYENCDRGGQYELDISCLNLKEWPAQVVVFPNIRILKAYQNLITEVPSMEVFKNIEVLNLASNKLNNLDQLDFSFFKTLKVLDLSRNEFVTLPFDIIKLPLLEKLVIHRNKLESLPTGMNIMKSLQVINAEYNNLTDIPKELDRLPRLHDLNLKGNPYLKINAMPVRLKRMYEMRLLMSSGDLRKGLIKRTLGMQREALNEQQYKLFPDINGHSARIKVNGKEAKNPRYVERDIDEMRSLASLSGAGW